MRQVGLVLCLVSSAAALNILQAKETEKINSKTGVTKSCVDGTWRWTKRNSSDLRDKYKEQPVAKIYYINMDTSDSRKHHMVSELKHKAPHVPFERFPAFKATMLNKHEKSAAFKNVASKYSKARYTPWLLKDNTKEVYAAIHISNYQVMEKIMRSDPRGEKSDDVYMVLEDDSSLDAQWQPKLKTILEHTPAEWDLIRIGYWGAARCGDKENNYVYAIQPPAKDTKALGGDHFYSGNTAYVVRPKSVPKILDIMRNSSFASIENVLMYPHRFPDGTDHQVLSYAVAPEHMLVHPTGGNLEGSSHR